MQLFEFLERKLAGAGAADAFFLWYVLSIIIFLLFLVFFTDNLDRITKYLIDLAKKGQSRDNITIIIVFFKHPSKIQRPTEIMESPTFDSFDVAAVKIEATEVSKF